MKICSQNVKLTSRLQGNERNKNNEITQQDKI